MGRIVWRAAEMQLLEQGVDEVRGHLGAPAPGPAESPHRPGPGPGEPLARTRHQGEGRGKGEGFVLCPGRGGGVVGCRVCEKVVKGRRKWGERVERVHRRPSPRRSQVTPRKSRLPRSRTPAWLGTCSEVRSYLSPELKRRVPQPFPCAR